MTETPEKLLATKIHHILKRLVTLRTCRLFCFKHVPWFYKTYVFLCKALFTLSALSKGKQVFFLVVYSLLLLFLKLEY